MDAMIIKLQEKSNQLSLLIKNINKIINFSSPVMVEELKEKNNEVIKGCDALDKIVIDTQLEDPIQKIVKKLEVHVNKIKSAINSYTGNFMGDTEVSGGCTDCSMDGGGQSLYEIYKASDKKRFF